MGSIYLIRHGQASFGAANYDVLSPLGVQQAEHLGEHLSHLNLTFDRAISGQLQRQQHTATAALGRQAEHGLATPDLECDSAFDEFDADQVFRAYLPELLKTEPDALSILQNAGKQRAAFQRLFVAVITMWLNDQQPREGFERWQDFLSRVEQGLQRLLAKSEKGQNIAVFTSGGTITAALHLITGIPANHAFDLNWQIVNTSVNRLRFRDQRLTLASFNGHTHLELLKNPDLITYR
ncbi:histidine phosphatase family protein [Atopomonas sediminilitoris]|uniref:histidine phosphatase family protein n=1 Tax=Atopomonas sediminilitoris TaxID=2919919 RepID=UPI001F4EE2E3|nr:histidine phosphatase family protein [Atopomonas sediminilitoris]